MDADDLFFRGSHQAQGIGFTQVAFFREGKRLEIIGGGDGGDTGFLQLFAVEIAGLDQGVDPAVDLLDLGVGNAHGDYLLSSIIIVVSGAQA